MATIGELRKEAKDLGIPPSLLRGATSADLQKMIEQMSGNGAKTATRKPAKSVPVKSKPAAKSRTRGQAKRSTSATATAKTARRVPAAQKAISRKSTTDSGRHELHDVDYNHTDGWNAREGSPPDRIIKALRKFKGNRTKVFDSLRPKIWDFMSRNKQDGTKRTIESAEEMLRYRISRTAWDFAMKTGQHSAATNRATYTRNGTATKKTARKAVGAARTARKATTAKKATRTAAKPQKATQARTTAKARTTKATAVKKTVAKKKTTARR